MKYLPFILLAICSLLLTYGLMHEKDPTYTSPMIGRLLPELAIPALDGEAPVSISEVIGSTSKPVMINFFASWCLPCQQEMPVLRKLAADKQIRIIGIAWKNKPQDAVEWLKEHGDPYETILLDQKGITTIPYALTGVPETFLVKDGVIIYHSKSIVTEAEILSLVGLP